MSLAHGNRPIVTDGLVLCLDAANPRSYSGTGTDWFDLSGERSMNLFNGPVYSSDNLGYLSFDGTNDYAETSSFNISGTAISIFSWFNFNSLQTGERVIVRKNVAWQLGFSNPSTNRVRCLLATSGGTTGWTVANDFIYPFSNNAWYNFGFVYDNGVTSFYVNGENIRTITTITGSIISNTNDVAIGANTGGATLNINANIPNVFMYNRALTADEIQQNFNAMRGRYGI